MRRRRRWFSWCWWRACLSERATRAPRASHPRPQCAPLTSETKTFWSSLLPTNYQPNCRQSWVGMAVVVARLPLRASDRTTERAGDSGAKGLPALVRHAPCLTAAYQYPNICVSLHSFLYSFNKLQTKSPSTIYAPKGLCPSPTSPSLHVSRASFNSFSFCRDNNDRKITAVQTSAP